jgi:hypothetical protein
MKLEQQRRTLSVVLVVSSIPFLLGMACGARVKSVTTSPDLHLRDYPNAFVSLKSAGSALSINTASVGELQSAQLMDAEAQAVQALTEFQFKLMEIGFNIVETRNEADAVFDLSVGTIRYDPIGGWIADKGIVAVKESETGRTLGMYSTEGRLITATVGKLISSLADAIREDY